MRVARRTVRASPRGSSGLGPSVGHRAVEAFALPLICGRYGRAASSARGRLPRQPRPASRPPFLLALPYGLGGNAARVQVLSDQAGHLHQCHDEFGQSDAVAAAGEGEILRPPQHHGRVVRHVLMSAPAGARGPRYRLTHPQGGDPLLEEDEVYADAAEGGAVRCRQAAGSPYPRNRGKDVGAHLGAVSGDNQAAPSGASRAATRMCSFPMTVREPSEADS